MRQHRAAPSFPPPVVSPSGGSARQFVSSFSDRKKYLLPLLILFLLSISLLLSSCRTTPWQGFPAATRPEFTWPSPPAQGRIAFVMEIRNHEDLFKSAGFWRSLGQIVGGPSDSSMVRPYAIARHSQGLLVTDPGRQVVHFYNWSKRQYTSIGPKRKNGLLSPVGVAALPDGAILVSDSQLEAVERFDSDGEHAGTFLAKDKIGRPAGIAVNPSGTEIYIADVVNHRIVVANPQGQVLRNIGKRGDKPGEFNFPTHLAIGSDGKLYVTDSMNFRIQVLNPNGSSITAFGRLGDAPGQFSKPKGIAVDSEGNIISVEGLYDALNFFDLQGSLLLTVGSPGSDPGKFWLPAGLAYDSTENLLFVADSYNRRVQVFRMLSETTGKQGLNNGVSGE